MHAKKRFGQHFLKSAAALAHMVAASALTEKDTVLEIGPGTGILTEKLL
ncbi:MAG TPA: rRNA adenine N-6-methyltransferase family protein, partial [Candidatus Paceibacterota bacterium]|nr:rRNA adenine N-6-methyltransferase family protein [Candidatus Paceibacterota bacterium]